jgi:hypothetical protein
MPAPARMVLMVHTWRYAGPDASKSSRCAEGRATQPPACQGTCEDPTRSCHSARREAGGHRSESTGAALVRETGETTAPAPSEARRSDPGERERHERRTFRTFVGQPASREAFPAAPTARFAGRGDAGLDALQPGGSEGTLRADGCTFLDSEEAGSPVHPGAGGAEGRLLAETVVCHLPCPRRRRLHLPVAGRARAAAAHHLRPNRALRPGLLRMLNASRAGWPDRSGRAPLQAGRLECHQSWRGLDRQRSPRHRRPGAAALAPG